MRNLEMTELTKYIRKTFIEEDEILVAIRKQASLMNREINISPEDGQFLQFLIKLGNIETIFEIGTFLGYSAIWQARAISDDSVLFSIEQDLESYNLANENIKKAKLENKVKLFHGTLKTVEDNFIGKKFDMIFIDANKNLYLEFLDFADKHLNENGIIVADNTLLSGAVYEDKPSEKVKKSTRENMIKFNEILADQNRYTSILLPNNDGLTLAIKK